MFIFTILPGRVNPACPSTGAALYASATREQALAIAVRTVENLKDKPLDYK